MTDERPRLEKEMQRRSRSFDAWALDYDRYRPSYPQALFDHISARLGLPQRPDVADLGAGTGKAARAMARRGWKVTAVEPGEGMLDVLRARAAAESLPIEARLAWAEETGLPDESVDLVTVAQAFHWFDKPRAVEEMARISRPNGGLAVFWNSRADERSDLLAAYTHLMEGYVPDEHVDHRDRSVDPTTATDLSQGDWFVVDDKVEIQHEVVMDADRFIGYAFTASYVRLFVDDAAQERLRDDLRRLIGEHFPDGRVIVPYDVDLYVGRRTAKGVDSD